MLFKAVSALGTYHFVGIHLGATLSTRLCREGHGISFGFYKRSCTLCRRRGEIMIFVAPSMEAKDMGESLRSRGGVFLVSSAARVRLHSPPAGQANTWEE